MSGIEEYDYVLPPALIARRPIKPRDRARLLVLDRRTGSIEHREVRDLPSILGREDRLVVNETKVIPARLRGWITRTGREIEILLVRESAPRRWIAWCGPIRALREADIIRFDADDQGTTARFLGRVDEAAELAFEGDVGALLGRLGHVPLPPYIDRPDEPGDRDDYQTVFARVPGAVAAPTAGLHFTRELFESLKIRGVGLTKVLLHVGPGTFRPIRGTDIREHRVEEEFISVGTEAAREIMETRARGGRIVAVGTTSVRALETWAGDGSPTAGSERWTGLTIVPPYRFRAVDALMTNFHLPRSSLLVLVSAFVGRERALGAYEEAIRNGYRFYSYGDAMLIL
jgi:S-adenosylmethionine:tRNA ribosyltransferase-isomerase